MATNAPVNTDLPASWMIPGTYIKLDLSGNGASLNNIAKRALLVGYKLASGTAAQDTPILCNGQSDANTFAGRGSDLARLYAAFISQVGGGQADVYLLPIIEPSGGTAATRTITFAGPATAADSVELWICGYHISTPVANADASTLIATNVAASINAQKDIPVTASAGSSTVTITYRHKGVAGEDLPIICNIPNSAASAVTASPGTLTYATNAAGAGSTTLKIGGTTYTAAISDLDTPTTVATAMAAAINGTGGPVTALAVAGVVTLYFATDRVVQRPVAAIITSTGITATVAAGTAGAGTPSLTAALAVTAAQSAFGYWATSFNDTTSLGSLSSHIEAYANGVYQKGQGLWAASTAALATAGAIPSGTTPALTASDRYHFGWCVDSPQQAYELAARHAAMVCVQDFKPYNYDGEQFQSQTATVPLMMTHRSSRPSQDSINSAMRTYNMSVYAVDESTGTLNLVRGRTTITSSDERRWDTALIQTADYVRYDMGVFLRGRFKNKSIKTSGTPHTANTITIEDVVDAIIERLYTYDGADFLDGADELKKAVKANINVLSPSRIDAYIPFKAPVPLHILAPVVGLV